MQQSQPSPHRTLDDNPWLAVFFFAFFFLLGFFVLSLRYHITILEWVEGGIYLGLLMASLWLVLSWRNLDRNQPREPFQMSLADDEVEVEKAAEQGSVLLGYTLDKAPVIWTDRTRTMQGLACGMSGPGTP